MDKTIFFYIGYLSLISSIFPISIALIRRKTLSSELRVLFLLVLISFFTDIVSTILSKNGINNLFIFHVYTLFEYVLIGYIFHKIYSEKRLSIFILIITIILIVISFLDAFYFHSLAEMNVITVFAESIVIISYVGIYFYQFLQKLEFNNPLSSSMFWFNAAILFYFSGNLFLFIFSNYVLNEPSNILWTINHVLTILFKLTLCIAFWKAKVKTI